MSLLNIVKIPSPNLRIASKEISKKEIPGLDQLILDMIETMYKEDGIGLAASQVGYNIRLAVIGKEATPDRKDWIIINPEIIQHSWHRIKDVEGCLSVPNITKEVSRFKKITVSTFNQSGEKIKFTAENFFARVLQHEIDHLNGILIIDK